MIDLPVISPGLLIGTIDLNEKKVTPHQNPIQFTCQSRIECCSTMKIPASSYDIQRIEDHGYELDQIIENSSPVLINAHSKHQPKEKAYILKRKPFDGTCTFLENNLCKIHEFKPFACKIYPFALEFIENDVINVVIHQDQLCKAIAPASDQEANNQAILQEIMHVILEELELRGYKI